MNKCSKCGDDPLDMMSDDLCFFCFESECSEDSIKRTYDLAVNCCDPDCPNDSHIHTHTSDNDPKREDDPWYKYGVFHREDGPDSSGIFTSRPKV